MTAPRIKAQELSQKEVAEALSTSYMLESRQDDEQQFWIRRNDGRAIPAKQSSYKRRRTSYDDSSSTFDYDDDDGDDDDDDDDDYFGYRGRYSHFGYGGGCMGFSSYTCDRLLECGVKPWESGADATLSALYDF